MTNLQSDNETWSDCPPETLTALASVLRRRQRWHRIQRIVTVTAAVLIIAGAGQYVITQSSQQQHGGPSYAGISCVEVSQLLPDYIAGKVSDGQRAKIAAHLELCSSCRGLERSLRDLQRSADSGASNNVQLVSLGRSEM